MIACCCSMAGTAACMRCPTNSAWLIPIPCIRPYVVPTVQLTYTNKPKVGDISFFASTMPGHNWKTTVY